METYVARIVYALPDDNVKSFERTGFSNVPDATEWLSAKLGWIMMNWGEINSNGLTVFAEVFNDDDSFSDMYELRCGM